MPTARRTVWTRATRITRTLRRSPRAVRRLLRLTPLGAGMAVMLGLPAISAWAQASGVAANVIKPDGRTATQQQVIGTRTDITTGTVKGDNAFNAFSRFEVGQGQTVNVHVPTQAQRVINIVTDAPIKVDGVLNGLKNGSLSGNLVFADPMGMVVSRTGVINAQSLQVVAPTRAHLDALMDGQGRIGDAAVKQLLDGQAPRSAEGRVQIDGQVNVLEKVRIEARRIDVDGRIKAGADAAHDAAFRSAVSTNGLTVATGMVERGGVIELVADEAISIKGTLDASQRMPLVQPDTPRAGLGGVVSLLAESIELGAESRLDVSGLTGGGVAVLGSISAAQVQVVMPEGVTPMPADAQNRPPLTQTLVVARGSRVEADAIVRGDGGRIQYLSDGSTDWGGFASSRGGALMGHGGFVEVSGRRRVQVNGLVDTTAAKGSTGTLLIDPDDLVITNGASASSTCRFDSAGTCGLTVGTISDLISGANLVLQADKTITFGGSDGSAVNLDLSSALNDRSKTISFTSKDITFNANSKLITGGGNVKLYALGAQSTGVLGTGRFSYDSSIGWGPLSIGEKVAGGTIRLNTGSAIITRGVAAGKDAAVDKLVRAAGDITLRAATIDLGSGSAVLAQADVGGAFNGGAVELTAYSLEQWHLGKATATSQVTLAGTVKADSIAVNAVARAEASPDGVSGFAVQSIQAAIGALTGMSAGYHETQADAKIDVLGSALLDAKTTLDISAASVNKAAGSVQVFTVDKDGNNLAAAAAIFVKTAGDANLLIKSGAQLSSGGKATLGAYNDATAKSSVKVLSNNSIGGVVIGYMAADVSATAHVEAGARLSVQSLDLLALQTGNMRNTANTTVAQKEPVNGEPAPPNASIGAAVAISDIKAHATATLGASLSTVGDVSVVADASLWQNYIAARNDVGGDPTLGDKLTMAVAAKIAPFASQQGQLTNWLANKFDALGNLAKGAPPIKAGAVITVNDTDLSSIARIGAGATINSTGQVAVVAQTEDRSIHNIAESKVNTKNSPTNAPVVNAAVAVGLYRHNAESTVGQNAVINATRFGSHADVYQPLDVTWLAGFSVDGLKDPGELFKHFAPPNFGMPQFVFTSWSTALAEQVQEKDANTDNTAAIAGSVNWTAFTNTAKAWVGAGARITASAADSAWSVSWKSPTAPLLDGDVSMNGESSNAGSNILLETQTLLDQVKVLQRNTVGEITQWLNNKPVVLGITLRDSLSFTRAVDVKARNQSAFLTFTGQPVDFGMTSVNLGSQGGKVAIGGAFNYAGAEHTTIAGIDDGAVIRAALGSVSVDALSQDRIISIAPTAGKGKGSAVNLIAAYSELDNTTVAVVSNRADLQARTLSVTATEDVSVWSAAGAAAFGASTAAVGLAVAVNELDGRTLATIGDLDRLSVGAVRPLGFSGMTAAGAIDAVDVKVLALTQGTSGAVAASAASVSTEDQSSDNQVASEPKSGLSKKWESLKSKTSSGRQSLVDKLASSGTGKIASARNWLSDKIEEKQQASAAPAPQQQTKFSLSAAGSASVNLGNLDTSSVIDAASLASKASKAIGALDPSLVTVRAANDTHQYAVSGSLALLKLNAPETQAGYGVSGAIAIDLEDNDTLARITSTSIKDYGRVAVESLSSGQRIAVGLGIAGSSGSKPSYMLSASYSMTESDNSTISAIDGGSITGSTDFRTGVEVLSYDKTETGVGAGALTVQRNKGGAAGASIGVALIHNQVESRIAGLVSDRLSVVDVRAYDPVVLGIGAASLGISTDKKSTTIEASVTYGEVENTTRAMVTDLGGVDSALKASGAVTVQATDLVPTVFKDRFKAVLAAHGTPAADPDYDFGASLRAGSQESFGGQSIGISQPGALMIGVAGGIAVGSGNAVGASAALARNASVHEALVEGATVNADSVNIDATDATLMVNVGIGVAGTSAKVALAGSVAVTLDESRATARLGQTGKTTSVTTTGTAGLGVTSATSDKVFAIAGAVGISTSGGAGGLAGSVGVNDGVAEALIRNATVTTSQARVLSTTASQHVSVAAAGGYGANASINGSFVINFGRERTTASVADSTLTATSLAVKAGDDASLAAQVYTGSGSFGFSKDVAGGAALTSNTVALTRDATVDRSILNLGAGADALDVQADSSVKMIGVTVAGGGSGNVAFNGAISTNAIANKTTARVAGNQLTGGGTVKVVAADRSEMNYGSAAVSIAGEAGIGVAIGFNLIANDITAELQGSDAQDFVRGTGKIAASDVRVSASSDEVIINAVYGVGGAGTVGGAGSIAVNVIDTDVLAHIGRGADVSADGTVAVTATAQDDIKSFAGALGLGNNAGIGLSSTVNVVRGATTARIGADNESQVKLDARGNGAGLAVNSGTLQSAIAGITAPNGEDTGAVERFNGLNAMKDYDATRAKLAETQTTVRGVAVNATSLRHVLSFDTTVGGAVEGVGIGAIAGAHVISATTTAEIAKASINQRTATANLAASADVAVKASSHHLMSTFAFSGGVGAGGGAAALGGDVFITQTTAQIRDSALRSARDVTVKASNESAQNGILAGAAGGGSALAGSAGVIVFDAGTEASILGGSTRAERDVNVDADNLALMNMITGAGSIAGGLAIAGAVTVGVSDTNTHAYIGRSTDTGQATQVRSGRDVTVSADSGNQINTFTMAISGGGSTSIAAIGAVVVASNETTASVRHADLGVGVANDWQRNPAGGPVVPSTEGSGNATRSGPGAGALRIEATDHGLINQISGAAGLAFGGGGGIGGTVSILVAKSNVAAELRQSEVDTGSLAVHSLNSQDQLAATVGVGAATDVGVGFAISLTMTGTGSVGSDAFGDASNANSLGTRLMNRAASVANTNRLGETGGTLSAADIATLNTQSRRDLSGTLRDAGNNSASAAVDASGVRAAGDVNVTADSDTALRNIAGAAGLGLVGGAGASVGVSYVYNATRAEVTGSTITAGGSLTVGADSGNLGNRKALDLLTVAGGAGFIGLGASVGIAHLENRVSAQADGLLTASSVTLTAADSTSAKGENVAAAVGGGALGIAVTTIDRAGSVDAAVNAGHASGQVLDAGSLSIRATGGGSNAVVSRAVAAGMGISGNGAAGTVTDAVAVRAGIGNNTRVAVGGANLADRGAVSVVAQRTSQLDAAAEGVGVSGGVQIGASVALATLKGSTTASVGHHVAFDAGSTLSVSADEGSGSVVKSRANASGGGVLVGANATVAETKNESSVSASIGDHTLLPDGAVTLHANHVGTQQADTFGVTVGGLLAVGANTSRSSTDASSSATLGNVKTNPGRLGDLDVAAQGTDTTTAKAVAGGGGLISGQAATALVDDRSRTSTTVRAAGAIAQGNPSDYTVRGGALSFDATHTAFVRADADTVNASAVGASGAITLSNVNASAATTVGTDVRLRGLGIALGSLSLGTEQGGGDNASGAGGGVANGSAVVAKTHINTSSSTEVAARAQLEVVGDPGNDSVGRLVLVAGTNVFTQTAGSLNTGGVIDVPYAEIESSTDGRNNVLVGADTQLRSVGDIVLGTSTINRTQAQAYVKTYGGVGITGGKSTATAQQTDVISVGANALLQAYGSISIATGRDADNALNFVSAKANTDVYNWTAVPISYNNRAESNAQQTSSVSLAAGSQVQAGRDVFLRTFKGDHVSQASGEGHNPYLEIFSTSTSDSHPGSRYVGSLALDGSVVAGYYRRRDFDINTAGLLSQSADAGVAHLPVLTFSMDGSGAYHQGSVNGPVVDAALALRPQGYIAKIDGFNPDAYYDANAKAKLGSVPNAALGAYALPDITVAGGNIEVDSPLVTGAGSLTARGGPVINVKNDSNRFLLFNRLSIPDIDSGGAITFTGAGAKPAGLAVAEVDKGRIAAIDIKDNYDTAFGGPAADLIFQSVADGGFAIRNPRGSVKIRNEKGNLWGATISALTVETAVPNGTDVIDTTGYIPIGSAPESTWSAMDAQYRPNDIGGLIDTAAYAYYRQNIGSSSDNTTYSRELQGIANNKGENLSGYLFRGNLGNQPGAYSGPGSWYDGRYNFDILPVKSLSASFTGAPQNAPVSAGRQANRIDYTAGTIDINAPIRAGTARDIDVTISNNDAFRAGWSVFSPKVGFFTCVLDATCRAVNGIYPQTNGQYKVPADALVYGANSPLLTVTYDPVAQRVSTGPIGTASIGQVNLVGRILNSNAGSRSRIELSTGTIQLSINNQSGVAFEMPRIETGGGAGDGVIRITDLNKTSVVNGLVKPLTSWWVSQNGVDVDLYQSYTAKTYAGLTAIVSGNGASEHSYDPQAGWRYEWKREVSASRSHPANNTGSWWNESVGPWGFAYGAASPNWQVLGGSTRTVYDPAKAGITYTTALSANARFDVQGVGYGYNGTASRYWYMATRATLTQTSSVRADFGLDIAFRGYASGGVSLASNANTYVGNLLNNPTGDTLISLTNGASLFGRDGGLIRSRNLTLGVAGSVAGSGKGKALDIELTGGGALNAVAGRDLSINTAGALRLTRAEAGSSSVPATLSVHAVGDITSDADLRAFSFDLDSVAGRIGGIAASDPLRLQVYNVGAGIQQRGKVAASANGDIKLALGGGDVRVVAIQAADGNVTLSSNGSLFDAKEGVGGSGRSETELTALWENTLRISGDRNASVQDYLQHTITPLDQQINRNYREYWTLRSLGTLGTDGRLSLSSSGLGKLRAQTAASLNVANPGDALVNSYANQRLSGYASSFDRVLGKAWSSLPAFSTQDAHFRFSADRYNEYWTLFNATRAGQLTPAGRDTIRQVAATVIGGTPSDAQLQGYVNQRFAALGADFSARLSAGWASQAAFTSFNPDYRFAGDAALLSTYSFGSFWGAERLQNEIRLSAFDPANGSGSSAIDHINISGRKVSLTSTAGAATVGRGNGVLTLTVGQPLTDLQRYALSQSSAPGDVTVVKNAQGQITALNVKDNRPFYVEAKTRFDALALGQVFVQGRGTLVLGNIKSDGSVRLSAQDGMTMLAGAAPMQATKLLLDGGTGGLGTLAMPLSINTPELSLARANESIFLTQPSGNLVIDVVSSTKDVSLRLDNGNLSQRFKDVLSLTGENLTLRVMGAVGDNGSGSGSGALGIETRGGTLRLDSKDAWLRATGTELKLGASSTQGLFSLRAMGSTDVRQNGDVAVQGDLLWLIGGDYLLDALNGTQADRQFTLTATSVGMGLGSFLKSNNGALALNSTAGPTVLADLSAKTGITVDSELAALQTVADTVSLRVLDAGGSVQLNHLNAGGTGIGGVAGGDTTAPLRIVADRVSLRTRSGDAFVSLRNANVVLDNATVTAGTLTLEALGNLTAASDVLTGQALSLQVARDFSLAAAKKLSAGSTLKLSANSLTMGAGSRASAADTAVLTARAGDARLATVATVNGLSIDAAKGVVSRVGATDLLTASAVGALIALNSAPGNTGGLGLGRAALPLRLTADRVTARTASGGIFLNFVDAAPKTGTWLEQAVAGTGDIVLRADGDLTVAGPISSTGNVDVQAIGGLVAADRIEALGVNGDLSLRAARLDLNGALTVGRDARLESLAGDLRIRNSLAAAQDAVLTSAAAMQAQDVSAGRDLLLNAQGPVNGDRLKAGRSLGLLRGTTLAMGELSSGVDMGLNIGTADIGHLESGSGLNLTALRADIGSLKVAGAATLGVTGLLKLGSGDLASTLALNAGSTSMGRLGVAGNAMLTVKDTAALGQLDAKQDFKLVADTATLGAAGVGGNAQLKLTQGLDFKTFTAAKAVTVQAGRIGGETFNAAGAASLDVVGALQLGSSDFGSNLGLSAGNAALGRLSVLGDASLSSAGLFKFADLNAQQVLGLQANDIEGQRLTVGAQASLIARAGLRLDQSHFGAGLTLKAGLASVVDMQIAGDADLSLDTRASMGRVSAAGNLSLVSDQLRAGSLVAGQTLRLRTRDGEASETVSGLATQASASERLLVTRGTAGTQASFNAADLRLDQLDIGGPLSLTGRDSLWLGTTNSGSGVSITTDRLTAQQINAGGDIDVNAGSAQITALRSGGNAQLRATQRLQLGAADVGGTLDAAGAAVMLNALRVGGAGTLIASDLLSLSGAGNRLGGALKAQAHEMVLSDLSIAGPARITAIGSISADALRSDAELALSAGSARLTRVQAGADASLNVSGALLLGGEFAAALTLHAGSLEATQLTVNGLASLTAESALQIGQLQVTKATHLKGGALRLDQAHLADALSLNAGSLRLGQLTVNGAARLDITGALQGQSLNTAALDLMADSVHLDALTVRGRASLQTRQALQIDALKVSEGAELSGGTLVGSDWQTAALTLDARGAATLGSLKASGDVNLRSGAALGLQLARLDQSLQAFAVSQQLGDVAVARHATLDATGLLRAARLRVGGTLNARAGQIDFGTLPRPIALAEASGNVSMLIGGAAMLTADTIDLADFEFGAATSLSTTAALTLAGSGSFKAGLKATAGNFMADNVTVTGDVTVSAQDRLGMTRLSAANATLSAASMALGSLSLGDSLLASTRQDLAADSLMAAKSITLQSGGTTLVKRIEAPTVTINGAKQISLDLLKTDVGTLKSATQIALADARANTLTLEAPQTQGRLELLQGELLTTRVSGVGGTVAQRVDLTLGKPARWLLPNFNAVDAYISTQGSFTQFEQAQVGGRMILTTPTGVIGLTGFKVKVLPHVDAQLFAPKGEFNLLSQGAETRTNALALIFNPGQIVVAANAELSPLAAAASAGKEAGARSNSLQGAAFRSLVPTASSAADQNNGETQELVGKLEF